MKLWIRSQNKERLEEVSLLYLSKSDNSYYEIKGNFCGLGEYATKERALEVLDEIQNIIIMQQLSEMDSHKFFQSMPKDTKNIKIVIDSMSVYEMPQR